MASPSGPETLAGSDSGFLPTWRLKTSGIIGPDERLPWGQTIVAGVQHVIAMFGATVLMPVVMGFDPNVAILFSGVGTILFFLIVGGRVPSYLGSSASFIGVVIAVTAYSGQGPNPNLPLALGGIVAAGALYAAIGVVVMLAGTRWIEIVMPPAVTGAVVAAIGLNLAPIAVQHLDNAFNAWIGLITVVAVGMVAVMAPGLLRRLPVLVGGIIGYVIYLVLANVFGLAAPISFAGLAAAPWFGLPRFESPVFDARAMVQIAPVAIILVAENLGHVKAIGAIIGRSLDPYLGRAFLGDGLATMVAGFGGGTGVTTYAENIGVMAVTRIYSTIVFVVAAVVAIALGFSPKFGALILTIPAPVLGGLSVVVFGLIAATAGRIWVEARVDFSNPRNLITVGAAVTIGAGNLALPLGPFTMGGIGTATFGAILLYHLLREPRQQAAAAAPARDAA
jgi:uracil-xanthine permease